VSADKTNSQGLRLFFDTKNDWLIERDSDGDDVAVWKAQLLRARLAEKHAETFWIQATSLLIGGEEHFKLQSVTHTKKPLLGQLIELILSGVITMDHLIKRKIGIKTSVSEKGPLFKINKQDLHLLFPKPVTYSLHD
jgi:hypothetical protein